jgi:hypothetical protein
MDPKIWHQDKQVARMSVATSGECPAVVGLLIFGCGWAQGNPSFDPRQSDGLRKGSTHSTRYACLAPIVTLD